LLRLKIPPPVVGLTIGLIIFLIDQFWSSTRIDSIIFKSLGCVLLCFGLLIEVWAVGMFLRARTTVNPLKPQNSRVLVIDGLYKVTRNPMYLGLFLLLLGWAFWVGNLLGLPLPFVLVWYLTTYQIKPEEHALEEIFGDQYTQYTQKVRRWI